MYAREIDGIEYTFGVSGKLIRNVLVMYDRETDSYWSQLIGEAVEGELKGTKLEFVPSWMVTWAEWSEMHPDTLALEKPFAGGQDRYSGYYNSSRTGIIPETISDDRLYIKDFVVGVELPDGQAKAYPFDALKVEPIINDMVDEQALLIVFSSEQSAGVAYDRTVDGQILTFEPTDDDWFTLIDQETGSTWNARIGQAIDGPLAGTQLQAIKSTTSFWFGWTDFHPNTLLYE